MSMPDFSLFYADSLSNRNKNLTAFPIFVEYGSQEKTFPSGTVACLPCIFYLMNSPVNGPIPAGLDH